VSALDRLGLPIAAAIILLLAVVLPVVRLRRRTGVRAVVAHRNPEFRQRWLAGALLALLGAVLAFVAAWVAVGPAALGVVAGPAWLVALGYGLVGAGVVVVMIAQAQMGASFRIGIDQRPTGLVTGGLYRWIRNPIYSGMQAALLGAVLVAPGIASAALAGIAVLLIGLQTRLEERHLLGLHGNDFRRWASRVGRFFPGIGRLSLPD
jgi:protein-S-isoprenylcysteine O-methyltransferase Ste14